MVDDGGGNLFQPTPLPFEPRKRLPQKALAKERDKLHFRARALPEGPLAGLIEEAAMALNRLEHFLDSLITGGHGLENGRLPLLGAGRRLRRVCLSVSDCCAPSPVPDLVLPGGGAHCVSQLEHLP